MAPRDAGRARYAPGRHFAGPRCSRRSRVRMRSLRSRLPSLPTSPTSRVTPFPARHLVGPRCAHTTYPGSRVTPFPVRCIAGRSLRSRPAYLNSRVAGAPARHFVGARCARTNLPRILYAHPHPPFAHEARPKPNRSGGRKSGSKSTARRRSTTSSATGHRRAPAKLRLTQRTEPHAVLGASGDGQDDERRHHRPRTVRRGLAGTLPRTQRLGRAGDRRGPGPDQELRAHEFRRRRLPHHLPGRGRRAYLRRSVSAAPDDGAVLQQRPLHPLV